MHTRTYLTTQVLAGVCGAGLSAFAEIKLYKIFLSVRNNEILTFLSRNENFVKHKFGLSDGVN